MNPAARSESAQPLQTQMLVLQPTPFCNIDCSYCYLPNRSDRRRMAVATLQRLAQHLRDDALLGEELAVVWHAGEPLVLPPHWYVTAFNVLNEALAGTTLLTQALQTNATRVNEAWCDFFLEHSVQVGVSIDGPAHLHDRHRRTRSGAPTHATALQGLKRLQARGVPFHVIAVVTAHSLADPVAFFDWFEEQGIHEIGCNIDEAEGAHAHSSLQGGAALEAAHDGFIQEALRRHAAGRLIVRELAQAQQLLAAPLPRWGTRNWPSNAQIQPLSIVTVNADGGFGTFSPELPGQPWPGYADFIIGNVHETGFLQALQGARFQRLWADVAQGVQACAGACAYFEQCGGGAPANKLYEHGHLHGTETLYCRSMIKRPFDAVLQASERTPGLQPTRRLAQAA